MDKIIPIAMISDDNFIMPTCVAVTSMIENKRPDTIYEIYVIMAECSSESEEIINGLSVDGCRINLIRRDLKEYAEIKQLAHVSKACLLKFEVSDLIPQYDKILYLDGDIIVRKDLTNLYELSVAGKYAAGVKDLESIKKDDGNINAGVVLFNAARIREEGLLPVLIDTRKKLGDRGSMDQQTYNMVFRNEYNYIDIKYNCVEGKLVGRDRDKEITTEKLNKIYHTDYAGNQDVVDDAVIIHFATSFKPWKYTFAPGAKEWYSYYLKSPYKEVPFKLMGRWGYRLNNIKRTVNEKGIKGEAERIKGRIEEKLKKNKDSVDWE